MTDATLPQADFPTERMRFDDLVIDLSRREVRLTGVVSGEPYEVVRSLDWDRALRRLDELNARVEDPTLWDNAKLAQEVMRERTRLDSAIGATRAIASEKSDTAELIEMAEAEGDEDMVSEAIASLKALAPAAVLLLLGTLWGVERSSS